MYKCKNVNSCINTKKKKKNRRRRRKMLYLLVDNNGPFRNESRAGGIHGMDKGLPIAYN
jgi:hypothetical protein